MRRLRLTTLVAALALAVAGCGGDDDDGDTAAATGGGDTAAATDGGGAADGEAVFASAGCGGCHTLEAAGSSGTVGPNLDDAQPSFELVVDRVTNGAGAMPAFEGQLSEQEIADVAAYVVESTSG